MKRVDFGSILVALTVSTFLVQFADIQVIVIIVL